MPIIGPYRPYIQAYIGPLEVKELLFWVLIIIRQNNYLLVVEIIIIIGSNYYKYLYK